MVGSGAPPPSTCVHIYLYMYEYLHHPLNTIASKSVRMDERLGLVFVHHGCVHITLGLEGFGVPGSSTPQLTPFVLSTPTPQLSTVSTQRNRESELALAAAMTSARFVLQRRHRSVGCKRKRGSHCHSHCRGSHCLSLHRGSFRRHHRLL